MEKRSPFPSKGKKKNFLFAVVFFLWRKKERKSLFTFVESSIWEKSVSSVVGED